MIRNLAALENKDLATFDNGLAELGQLANEAASAGVFADYRERKSANTRRRQDADLSLFAQFLRSAGVKVGELNRDPEAWQGVTWGLVAAFMRWQLAQGYAIGSANVHLSTIKVYAKLSLKAGSLTPSEYALISAVEGYAHKEIKRIDEQRESAGVETRKGAKKAEAVKITPAQAKALKAQPDDSAQGRRDALIMCLLLDHGLRVGELAALAVSDFDLKTGELRFYRQKVNLTQTHRLTSDCYRSAALYLAQDAPAMGSLWRSSNKSGRLGGQGLTARAITDRVRVLAGELGIEGLSAHDCRHFWATSAARNGTQIDRLQDAGGWSSPAMPLRYVEAAKIANSGVILD